MVYGYDVKVINLIDMEKSHHYNPFHYIRKEQDVVKTDYEFYGKYYSEGCGYSQDRRYDEGWYDCSSLVYRLYKEVGIELPQVASTQGKYCFENAIIINKEELRPGDIIFYSTEENGDFRNITHVAIYVGDGMMVHAANSARGVVLDPLRTNNVVFFSRPYI